jgi:hypothetical protein
MLFDSLKTSLKLKFDSEIKLKNKNEIVVFVSDKSKSNGIEY